MGVGRRALESLVRDPSFWRGRRIFVTGHTGFKGSWLSLWLVRLGAEVTGYALAPATKPSLFHLADVGQGLASVIGDIRDRARLEQAIAAAAPEIVIHMAAQALVRESYDDPVGTFDTNVMGTVALLDTVRRTPSVRAVVIVTSDKCYENREWVWGYREDEAMGGHDPYSASKGCAELVTAAYRRSFFAGGVALATARAGNVIGGGDWSTDRLVPDIMRALVAGMAVAIRNPHAIRPWQHVLEPLGGYLALAQALFTQGPEFAEGWNFGPREGDARPVEWIVRGLTEAWGDGAAWQVDDGPHPHEANYLKLDCAKAAARLGWRPRWTLDKALDSIVAFHRIVASGGSVRAEALRQIAEYEATPAD